MRYDNMNIIEKKIAVVQLCECISVYNDNLQNQLVQNEYFKEKYDLCAIYLDVELEKIRQNKENRISKWQAYIILIRKLENDYCFDNNRDIINIQFVTRNVFLLIPWIKKNFKKVVCSYWGSDLLEPAKFSVLMNKRILNISSVITVETNEMEKIFNSVYKNRYKNKVKKVRFGLTELDEIDNVSEDDKSEYKYKNAITRNKTIVVIGYNRLPAQRHKQAIESLFKTNINRDDLCIIIPWTYGGNYEEYKKELIRLLEIDNFEYHFIENRLSNREMAILRSISDIMVHVREADSLSASMLETLYAGNHVIAGDWFPYEDLYDMGIHMDTVSRLDEIGERVERILSSPWEEKTLIKNKKVVREYSGWESNINKWIDIYDK